MQFLTAHDLGDQAGLEGFLCQHGLAQQQHAGGPLVAQPVRQQLGRTGFRHRAKIRKGCNKLGIFGCHHHIHVQQHGGADAHRITLHSGYHHFREGIDGLDEIGCLAHFTGLGIEEVHQVVTGAEGFAFGGKQHHTDVVAFLCRVQQGNQIPVHGAGEGVQFVRAVQGNFHHRFGVSHQNQITFQCRQDHDSSPNHYLSGKASRPHRPCQGRIPTKGIDQLVKAP